MKSFLINSAIILILFLIVVHTNWRVRDRVYQIQYDLLNTNEAVFSKDQIKNCLAAIETTSYAALDEAYMDYTKSNEGKYKKLVKQLTYYKVKRSDLNKKIVGHFRLKEFICKDDYYKECIMREREEIVCIFNEKIFYKTLELQEELEKLEYDKYAFDIVNGHRHPAYNEQIGGAKLSRHIKGEAVDIFIGDINRDGSANKADKAIVLDLLERKIIGNKGGIGLYPGTGNVHYDVRGTRARWDSY